MLIHVRNRQAKILDSFIHCLTEFNGDVHDTIKYVVSYVKGVFVQLRRVVKYFSTGLAYLKLVFRLD